MPSVGMVLLLLPSLLVAEVGIESVNPGPPPLLPEPAPACCCPGPGLLPCCCCCCSCCCCFCVCAAAAHSHAPADAPPPAEPERARRTISSSSLIAPEPALGARGGLLDGVLTFFTGVPPLKAAMRAAIDGGASSSLAPDGDPASHWEWCDGLLGEGAPSARPRGDSICLRLAESCRLRAIREASDSPAGASGSLVCSFGITTSDIGEPAMAAEREGDRRQIQQGQA